MNASNRQSFARSLGEALASPSPAHRLTELLHCVLVSDPGPWESDDQQTIRGISERLDVESENGDRLILAGDMQLLLANGSSNSSINDLSERIADRLRVIAVGRKYLDGDLTRTSFLSYVAEQRWPDRLRQRVAGLAPDEISTFVDALKQVDITQLEAIFAV